MNQSPDEVVEATKKKAEKDAAARKKTLKKTWAGQFEFEHLFKIKGRSGLWMIAPHSGERKKKGVMVNKSGLIGFQLFGDPDHNIIDGAKKATQLSGFTFYQKKGSLKIEEVMNNVHENLLMIKSNIGNENWNEAMELALPDYNPEEFKKHHLKKVVTWYEWLVIALQNLEA